MRFKEGRAIHLPQAKLLFHRASDVRRQTWIVYTAVSVAPISASSALLLFLLQGMKWNEP